MNRKPEPLIKNCDAVSEVIGEILMTAIAVLAISVISLYVLSFEGPTDAPHVDIDAWVDTNSNIINFRHTGGDTVNTASLRILLGINGIKQELNSDNMTSITGSDRWGLGDTIEIDTQQLWGTYLTENDTISATIVHTTSKVVLQTGTLIGGAQIGSTSPVVTPTATATATATPTPPSTITPTTVYDTSGGSATVNDVLNENDGAQTVFDSAVKIEDAIYQHFGFSISVTDLPSTVSIKIRHYENGPKETQLSVWEESTGTWHTISLIKDKGWHSETIDVSSFINTIVDVQNIKMQYRARGTKPSNIDYIAVYLEW